MCYNLFLDDLRAPPDQTWVVLRSVAAAKQYVAEYGLPAKMSLDHDLGGEDAPVFLRWLIDELLDGTLVMTKHIDFNVHSANPVGVNNLHGLWDGYLRFVERNA